MKQGRCQPAPPNGLGETGVVQTFAAARPWRYQFRDDAVAVHYQDRLARGGEADVLTELVLQRLQPDGAHIVMVASRGYHVKRVIGGARCPFLMASESRRDFAQPSCRAEASGFLSLRPAKREKSRSVVCNVAPCSMASAASAASMISGPRGLPCGHQTRQDPPMTLPGFQDARGGLLKPGGHRGLGRRERVFEHLAIGGDAVISIRRSLGHGPCTP